MKTLFAAAVLSITVLATARSAAADSIADDGSKLRLSADVDLYPTGNIDIGGTPDISGSTAFAYGVGVAADYQLNRNIFIGVAPRIIFNVTSSDNSGDNAGTDYDLRARIGAGFGVAPKLRVYGYVAPGYSIITGSNQNADNGFTLGIAAGASYAINSTTHAYGELGYSFGFQSTTDTGGTGDTIDVHVDFFHLAFGVSFDVM